MPPSWIDSILKSGTEAERQAIDVYAHDPALAAERKIKDQLHADLPIWMYGASPEQIAAFRAAGRAGFVKPPAVIPSEVCDCGTRPVDGVCSWTVKRYVPAVVDSLREGEFVCRWNQDQPRVGTCRVETLEWSRADYEPPPGFRHTKAVTIGLVIRYQTGTVKKTSFTLNEGARIKVLRAVPCGVGVCWMCGREPAEGIRVCNAHRDSWEKVA